LNTCAGPAIFAERGLTVDLHAYQCHVFLDWRELRSTAEKPWDRLCDQLNGRGVPNLDDALVNLELRPVHDALRRNWIPVVRLLAGLAEHPRALPGPSDGERQEDRAGAQRVLRAGLEALRSFLRAAQAAYASRPARRPAGVSEACRPDPGLLAPAFRERLRAAMRIPAIEALFPAPWTAAARRMLPSPSPQFTATAMWGPVSAGARWSCWPNRSTRRSRSA
jgi:hypothetical protein